MMMRPYSFIYRRLGIVYMMGAIFILSAPHNAKAVSLTSEMSKYPVIASKHLQLAQSDSPPEAESPNVGLLPELEENENDIESALDIEDPYRIEPQLGPLAEGAVNFPPLNSILFFPGQMNLIRDFERGFFDEKPQAPRPNVRNVPEGQIQPQDEADAPERDIPPTRSSPRNLTLSGITYNGPKKWTIWLNGQRITPETVPEEIFKINVEENFVELIWHDKQTHNIYPVRLRPNQRFNLDARMFLPG